MNTSRAFALVFVLLALSTAATVLISVQAASIRQAAAGRETLAITRARWAARAGVESTIAELEALLIQGERRTAWQPADAMRRAASGTLDNASWSIAHHAAEYSSETEGPQDPHAKLNINLMSRNDLLTLDGMTEDVADSILDWIDPDDDPRPLGAEAAYYASLPSPILPRNAPLRTLAEIALVAGVDLELLRGEDADFDGRLDPEENDADLSWPPDNADGALDAGWSETITAASIEPALSPSGEPRLALSDATSEDLLARVPSLSQSQADAILDFARSEDARLETLVSTSLSTIASRSGADSSIRNLSDDQLRALFDECSIEDLSAAPSPGRLNVNTVERSVLDSVHNLSDATADSLIEGRQSAASGFTNPMDLLEIPRVTRSRLDRLGAFLSVGSGAYVISSRGVDRATGTVAELVCVIDLSRIPLIISEARSE